MHLLLFRLKTIGWDELPEGVLVCRHLPPTASPKRTPSGKTPPCSCVRLERLSRAPGKGSLLHKPLGCVPFRNNVFELTAGQRQVLQGRDFFRGPALISAAAVPAFCLLPFSSLFHSLSEAFSLSIPTCPSLFFSSRTSIIDCCVPAVLSVGVAASLVFLLLCPARELERLFEIPRFLCESTKPSRRTNQIQNTLCSSRRCPFTCNKSLFPPFSLACNNRTTN